MAETKKTTKKTTKKKMGVPTKMTPEKIRQLKAICRMKPTLADCAAFLDVNASTIERYANREHGKTFAEFREENMVQTRFMLIRTAIKKAEHGDNTMLIFCLKNLCGWVDKVDNQKVHTGNIKIKIEEKDKEL